MKDLFGISHVTWVPRKEEGVYVMIYRRKGLLTLPLLVFGSRRKRNEKDTKSQLRPRLLQMLSIRTIFLLALFLFATRTTVADEQQNKHQYIRGEKVNPASRAVNTNEKKNNHASDPTSKNDVLEFQAMKRLSGSKPAQEEGARFKQRTTWF